MNDTNTADTPTLTVRVAKIERENRLMKVAAIITLLCATAAIALGQAPTKRTVVADEFILKDKSGTMRATLGISDNQPVLTLLDANGKTAAKLMPDAITFHDSGGAIRVLLGSDTAISYELVGGRTQIIDQGPGLLLFTGGHRTLVDLRVREKAQGAALSLYSQSPTNLGRRVVLTSTVDGPSLTLSDDQGFRSIVGSVSQRESRTGTSSRTSAASVVLFDKDGNSIWSAP